MRWYGDGLKHRQRLRTQWTTIDAEPLYEDDSENEAYHDNIRGIHDNFKKYGPLMNIVVIPGSRDFDNKLRGTVKKSVNCCRKLTGLFGCATSVDAHALVILTRTLTSSSHAASSSRLVSCCLVI
ncbi:hypothetical protein D1007_56799 [Hordeum vulgare]|nr:hypothetical protein D1007_56799 [Hordeum vulgare]